MFSVAALLYPQALATSITMPLEILQAASQMASVAQRGKPRIQTLLAAPDLRPMVLSSGLSLQPDIIFDDLPSVDLLLLPAIWRNPLQTLRSGNGWEAVLQRQNTQGALICSVGTGSYLLAEVGLLDGRPATTHWNYLEHFAARYPHVDVKSRHLITQSDNIYCVGSVNSIADLILHIVEQWLDNRTARAIEQQFSPEIRRSFQSAAYQNEADSSHHDELIADAQQWLQDHLSNPASMQALAAHLSLSPRTLNRRFKKATGITPLAYLQNLRVTNAKDLLRHSNLGVGDIAWQVGLHDPAYFTQFFRSHTGVSPLQYRRAARGTLFHPQSNG